MQEMDVEKPDAVALYEIRREINGEQFGGHIPATSADEAEILAKKMGAELYGRLVARVSDEKICSICGGPVTIDMTHPKPEADDWPEDI